MLHELQTAIRVSIKQLTLGKQIRHPLISCLPNLGQGKNTDTPHPSFSYQCAFSHSHQLPLIFWLLLSLSSQSVTCNAGRADRAGSLLDPQPPMSIVTFTQAYYTVTISHKRYTTVKITLQTSGSDAV
jgi:hypothetical protein